MICEDIEFSIIYSIETKSQRNFANYFTPILPISQTSDTAFAIPYCRAAEPRTKDASFLRFTFPQISFYFQLIEESVVLKAGPFYDKYQRTEITFKP